MRVNTYYGVFGGGQSLLPLALWPWTLLTKFFGAAYSGVIDIVLAFLSWSIVWRLQMKRKEKIGVAVAMSMGVL